MRQTCILAVFSQERHTGQTERQDLLSHPSWPRCLCPQGRPHHLCSEHDDLSAGRRRDLLYPGPHRPGAGDSGVRRGQEWTRTGLPHVSRSGPQVARCPRLGGHLLLHAGGKFKADSRSSRLANFCGKLNVHYRVHKFLATAFPRSG